MLTGKGKIVKEGNADNKCEHEKKELAMISGADYYND